MCTPRKRISQIPISDSRERVPRIYLERQLKNIKLLKNETYLLSIRALKFLF
jgi:hypothetical protein